MNSFSISDLEQYSGVKAHTIRIWEQRYNALTPMRSEGNTRYYDDLQLRRLLNMVSLSEKGHRISELGGMSDKQLFGMLQQHDGTSEAYYVSQLIAAGISYDEIHFEKLFSHCLLRFGLKETYAQVLLPMLNRIGLLWSSNVLPASVEHFLSNLVRQKLFAAIDSLPPFSKGNDGWLLFLPEDEFHEIGLLVTSYILRAAGKKVIYLGPNVPKSTLDKAVNDTSAENLLLFFIRNQAGEHARKYVENLINQFPRRKVYVASHEKMISSIPTSKKVHLLKSISDLDRLLYNNVSKS